MNHPSCLVFILVAAGHQDEHQDETEKKGEREKKKRGALGEPGGDRGEKVKTQKKTRMKPG
eukprot:4381499-Karenia_brevis.AAC.1